MPPCVLTTLYSTMAYLSRLKIQQHVRKAQATYADHAFLQHELIDRLLERLSLILMKPKVIAVIGARDHYLSQQLQSLYPNAQLITMSFLDALEFNAAMECEVDLIVSPLLLHWLEDIGSALLSFNHMLRPEGLLLFSTVGPDTLCELRTACEQAGLPKRVHEFVDMHEIGDALLSIDFLDPVMDMEKLTLRYDTLDDLTTDLRATGVTNARTDQPLGLLTRSGWERVETAYPKTTVIEATVEVVYGHAWKKPPTNTASIDEKSEVTIPISTIQKRSN